MAIYNPPSSTAQYQLTASYLSSSFSSNTASLFIQSDGTFSQGLVILSPSLEASGKATSFQISAGSSSDGSVSGDLYLYTKNSSGAGNPGGIILQTGGKSSTVSGTIGVYSTNIQIGDFDSNNYVKVFRDSSNNRVQVNALYSVTASAARDGILFDSPFIYKDGMESTRYSTRTFTSNAAVQFDQTVYTTYAAVGYITEQNLIFLNSTISNATASNMRKATDANGAETALPIGSMVQLYNSGSYDIYFKHNETSVINTRLYLSGSASRLLPSKRGIKFILDSDGNWYEI